MRIKAVALRILNQIRHDKRTVGIIVVAPLLILTIVYFILDSGDSGYDIGIIKAPDHFVETLEDNEDVDVKVSYYDSALAEKAIKDGEITAAIYIPDNENDLADYTDIEVLIDGTDASKASRIKALITVAAAEAIKKDIPVPVSFAEPEIETDYIYGSDDWSLFDNYGAPMIGIIIFFLVFLIAGINFLGERTSGTLQKLLSTPIRRGEIITGYALGFSVLAVLQSSIVTFFVIYVLKMPLEGSIWLVLIVNLVTAMCALTLGMLLSTLANSEFQMVQFIPLVILPQIFLCGLFELSGGWEIAGYFMPLYYTTDALTEVMLHGNGLSEIYIDLIILVSLSTVFMAANSLLLKKQRSV
ncbi:MAG TPA: ABC transporter permease [Bacillota bacterium]|nr:ABC transporter permease [Bacillota bacterium]HUM55883.1 ABC transporter permease [Bacillota bacterium]